jgi:hypothetical protein
MTLGGIVARGESPRTARVGRTDRPSATCLTMSHSVGQTCRFSSRSVRP